MFDQDPNEQANISGADLAIMCDRITELERVCAMAKEFVDQMRYCKEHDDLLYALNKAIGEKHE